MCTRKEFTMKKLGKLLIAVAAMSLSACNLPTSSKKKDSDSGDKQQQDYINNGIKLL